MTNYTITPGNQAQYQTTNAGDHAVDLVAGDVAIVQAGAVVSATGANADGMFASGTTGVSILGTVLSTQGSGMSGSYTAFVLPTGTVTGGQLGIRFIGGGNHLSNQGTITGSSGIEFSTQGLQQTVLNEGTITGTAQDGAILRGHVYLTNTGSITGLHSGVVASGIGGTFSISNLGLIRGGQEGYAIDLAPGGAFATIVNSGRIEGAINCNAQVYYEGRAGIVTGEIYLGGKNDTAYGGAATEIMYGSGGADFLHGGGGNDILDGGGGLYDDTLNGGDGFDTVVFRDEPNGSSIKVNMANPNDSTNNVGADTYISIEALVGASFGDTFIGNADANTFTGKGGNDTLDGGGGTDTAVFSGHASDYTVTKNGATVTVQHNNNGTDGTDTLTNIRFARFEADNKTVALINSAPAAVGLSNASVAENAANAVVGRLAATDADGDAVSYAIAADPDGVFAIRDGELVVTRALDFEAKTQHSVTVKAKDAWGGETTQTFTIAVTDLLDTTPGTPGNPGTPGTPGAVNLVLRGTSGANTLTGQAGHDTLYGGAGKDVLTGSTGQDMFVFDTRPNSRTNVDTITDFNAAEDTIWLKKSNVFSKIAKKGVLEAKAFYAGSKAHDASDRIVYNKKTGVLYYDEDGSGAKAAVAIAKLANKASLTKNDFFVI